MVVRLHALMVGWCTDKKMPVIFHNLRGYDGHLIMQFISMFDQKIRIPSKSHQIESFENNLVSLQYFDDKRYILDDGIENLTCKHKDVK